MAQAVGNMFNLILILKKLSKSAAKLNKRLSQTIPNLNSKANSLAKVAMKAKEGTLSTRDLNTAFS
jgi:hypothetical protein